MRKDSVLTLVAAEPSDRTAGLVDRASAELGRIDAAVGDPDWLAPREACDLPFAHPDLSHVEPAVRRALEGESVDIAVQATEERRKRFLAADMESTIIRNEMLEDLADFVGCRAEVEKITARAMNGELDFRAALEERVALLAGLPTSALEASLTKVVVNPGAATLVATLRAHGVRTALVSGGFHFFVERIKDRLGFDFHDANELVIEGGKLTGRVREPVRDRTSKQKTLERLCRKLGIETIDAAAVGDGANDLAMLAVAGLGVAYHAKPSVASAARFRIEHSSLTSLLYFQGFRRADFRSS